MGKRPFSKDLTKSLVIHIVLIAFFLVYGKIKLGQEERIKDLNYKLIQRSVRVDVVAMPTQTVKELKALEQSKTSPKSSEKSLRPQEKRDETYSDDPKAFKKAGRSFKDLINKIAKKDIKEVKETLELNKELKELIVSGNKIRQGTALTGSASDEAVNYDAYIDLLRQSVLEKWRLPSYLHDQGFRCQVRVFISARGNLVKTQVVETSGSPEFDQKALDAINQANLPTPPRESQKAARSGKFVLVFPL